GADHDLVEEGFDDAVRVRIGAAIGDDRRTAVQHVVDGPAGGGTGVRIVVRLDDLAEQPQHAICAIRGRVRGRRRADGRTDVRGGGIIPGVDVDLVARVVEFRTG